MSGTRRAFTLIELLVVIAIIALLISMLLPAIALARESGRNVVCMSNNRQLGTALGVYLSENKGYFPGDHWEPPGGSVMTWPARLRRLTQTEAIFNCPTRPSDFRWVPVYDLTTMMQANAHYVGWRPNENSKHAWTGQPRSYGYNGWGFEEFGAIGTNSYGLGGHIKNPIEYMVEKKAGLNLDDKPYWEPNENKVVMPTDLLVISDSNGDRSWDGSIGPNANNPGRTHFINRNSVTSGKTNFLFQDTHVASAPPLKYIFRGSDSQLVKEQKMMSWNIDHKPHPEQWN